MKLTDFLNKAQAVKGGSFVRVKYQTEQTCYKGHQGEVTKVTVGVYRLKCAYGNLNYVKARDAESTEINTEKVVNWVVKNLVELTEKGHRVWLYTDAHHRPHTTYYYNGQEVKKQWLIDNKICSESMLKSHFDPSKPLNHPIYKYVEDIIEIGA